MNCVPQRVLMRDIAFLAFTLHIDVIFWVKERGNKIFSWKHGLCNHLTIWKYFMVQTTTFIINQDQTKTILSFTIYILQTLQWGHFVFVSLQAGGLRELAGWCKRTTVWMWINCQGNICKTLKVSLVHHMCKIETTVKLTQSTREKASLRRSDKYAQNISKHQYQHQHQH